MIFTHNGERYRVRGHGGLQWWSDQWQEWLEWGWDVEGFRSYDVEPLR